MTEWIRTEANPESANVLSDVRLFAVLGTWMEADIVAATVRNALTQGCERVYLIDNASSDDTVAVALAEGAELARRFGSDRYDEPLRLGHMNAVAADVSSAEPDPHLWWLFLDADEFPHGPGGMRLVDYLRTLDSRFRIVGARFFDHYPSGPVANRPGRHPLDFQPLCEEVSFPMCRDGHRKHPLLRHDRGAAPVIARNGFHSVSSPDQLVEPARAAFLHHFPFREQEVTTARLAALWHRDASGHSRADSAHDTHMLARFRSLEAVYRQQWGDVENFIARDPYYAQLPSPPPPVGVSPRPWGDQVEAQDVHVLRWHLAPDLWQYGDAPKWRYGDDTSYRRGLAFLDGYGTIEDWGCGFAHARSFVRQSAYVGIDGSPGHADRVADLRSYRSATECIFMRHVLEHNADWERILAGALASFTRRMVLVLFTPFVPVTCVIGTSSSVTDAPVSDIAFSREAITRHLTGLEWRLETIATETQYGVEHLFYLERRG